MNEKLIIRVGEGTESPIHWLIWSESNKETIASGELASSLELELVRRDHPQQLEGFRGPQS